MVLSRVENIVGKGENAGYQNVFKRLLSQGLLTTLKKERFENIVVKEENAGNQHIFCLVQNKFFYLDHLLFVICKCFEFRLV